MFPTSKPIINIPILSSLLIATMHRQEDDHMQIMNCKGKRTKRQRLPSPLRLTMSTTTCSSLGRISSTDNSSSSSSSLGAFDLPTTSMNQEDQDMANCLILLAQGQGHNNNNNKGSGLYLYECKTCNRCFPSFQALGGHRASHKKYSKATTAEEKQGARVATTFVNPVVDNNTNNHPHGHYCDPTLTLQLPTALSNNSSSSTINTNANKSKVHECSICGAEFSSGQALGGHMRRHRNFLSTSSAPTRTGAIINANGGHGSHQIPEARKDSLNLDLNLPAPDHEDHHHRSESNLFPFQAKEKVIVFSATSLVDCHY